MLRWTYETIHGEFTCHRYTAQLPWVGFVRIERWDPHEKLDLHYTYWRAICEGLRLNQALSAHTVEQAQAEASDFVCARVNEILTRCQTRDQKA